MNINIGGFFCATSYGLVALNVIKALTELGHRVSAVPFSLQQEDIPPQFVPSLQQALNNYHYWDVDAPSVNIVHQNMMSMHVGRKRIGWPIFELDRFNDHELHHLRSLDQIIVCSEWAKDVCRHNGLTQPINVVPLGVDSSIFYPSSETRKPGPTVFLSVGKKEIRKLHDKLYIYMQKAFMPGDNVELHLAWANRILDATKPKESADWDRLYQSCRMKNHIKLYPWLAAQNDVASLMRQCDCYVGLSRAEGWNLNLLEAMAVGKPCITNSYAAHTEFATKYNSHLVPFRDSETAHDGTWFFGQGNWMNFDNVEEELIVNYMRQVHEQTQEGNYLWNSEGLKTAAKFSWKNTAECLIEAVS